MIIGVPKIKKKKAKDLSPKEYLARTKQRKQTRAARPSKLNHLPSPKKLSQKEERKLLKRLGTQLDRWCSYFVRFRDSDRNGYCFCVTCGRKLFWKEAQWGHCYKRSCSALHWDTKINTGVQCKKCNGPGGDGEQALYIQYIQRKHGMEVANRLTEDYKRLKFAYFPKKQFWFLEEIEKYKKAVFSLLTRFEPQVREEMLRIINKKK